MTVSLSTCFSVGFARLPHFQSVITLSEKETGRKSYAVMARSGIAVVKNVFLPKIATGI
jgi:hypothetical protein